LAFDAVSNTAHDAYLAHYGIDFHKRKPGLRHTLGGIKTERHDVCVHLWHPADPTGSAIVVHGYYDHVGLYRHLIGHLLERNLAVLAFDLPGHGLSSGAPATIETFDHYVAAFNETLAAAKAHLPKPWHLIGQSTGAAVAMEWLLANRFTKADVPFRSIVLLAPLVRPYAWAPFNRIVYEIARRLITERPRTFVTNADDDEFIAFLRDRDPLQARILPVQWVTAMQNWRRRFERYEPTDLEPLVIQGHRDRTVDRKYNIRVIERLFRPRVVYIDEARHHLVNESPAIRARMFAAIDEALR
jgi:lysophospholipase